MSLKECPICFRPLHQEKKRNQGGGPYLSCPGCGDYFISDILLSVLPSELGPDEIGSRALLSHSLRQMSKGNKWPRLTVELTRQLLKNSLPSIHGQIDNMVVCFAEDVPGPGEQIEISAETHQSVAGSRSEEAFAFVIDHLLENGLISGIDASSHSEGGNGYFALSVSGWDYYNHLLLEGSKSKKVFMAMKFGDEDLDAILDNAFRPAAQETGFKLYKLDDVPKAGLIDDRLRVEIRTSRFLIADLTHENAGAYWEAGYAEGLGKPVIYTCEKSKFKETKTHFDTNHHLTVVWDSDKIEDTKEQLKATIRATLPSEAILED